MSIKMKGVFPKQNEQIEVHGIPGKAREVLVHIHGDTNRDTDAKLINKYLKNGWHWNLFVPIVVAEFPEESGIGPLLLDGDHRRHMYMLTFPEREKIPAHVIQVADMEEYHRRFWEINMKNRKNASREEVFVHQVKAGEPEAISTMQELIRCGVCVYGSSDPGGIVGFASGPKVKVGAFRRTLKQGATETKMAIGILKATWPSDTELKAELMEALAILLNLYPTLQSQRSQIAADFKIWFQGVQTMYTQRDVAMDNKNSGGAVVNKHALSIARGLLKDFRKVQVNNGAAPNYKQKMLKLSTLDNLIDG